MKRTFILLLALTLIMVGCFGCKVASESIEAANTNTGTSSITPGTISVDYDNADMDSSQDSTGITYISLEGSLITLNGTGAKVDGSIVTIMYARTYNISGILKDGQIIKIYKD